MSLRLIVVDPGASSSVSDVRAGVVAALRRRGDVEVAVYELAGRLAAQADYLHWLYRREVKRTSKSATPQPTPSDVVKRASYALPDAIWRHQADWVLVVSGMFLHPDNFATLRWFGKTKLGLLATESPYDDEFQKRVAQFADVLWTNERKSVGPLSTACPRVHYLRHAYNPSVHYPAPPDDVVARHDVVFVGTGFMERIELLAAVDWDALGVDLGLYGNWTYLPSRHHLQRYVRGGQITNQTTTALYRNAKIGLNLYRSSMGWGKDAERLPAGYAESCNPRAYELAATGCFAVSEYRPEVPEVFGDLVPTFRTPDELAAQVARWLADDAGRARVREALPAQVRPQSWDARVDQMLANMRAADAARMATAWVMPAAPSVTTMTAGQVPA